MEKYNVDIIKISDERYIKKCFEEYERNLSVINSFGVAKIKEKLDLNLVEFIDEKSIDETAIFVPMDYYCLINNEGNAFTFGIGSCCGLVIFNENGNFLMHISPKHPADEILILLKSLNLLSNGKIYIFPGSACEFKRCGNQIDYKQLGDKLQILGNEVYTRKFNTISGSVFLLNGKLVIKDDDIEIIEKHGNGPFNEIFKRH